jgi:hypothetical protein
VPRPVAMRSPTRPSKQSPRSDTGSSLESHWLVGDTGACLHLIQSMAFAKFFADCRRTPGLGYWDSARRSLIPTTPASSALANGLERPDASGLRVRQPREHIRRLKARHDEPLAG